MSTTVVGLICAVIAAALFLLAAFHVAIGTVDLVALGLVFLTGAVVTRVHVHTAAA